MNEGPTSVPAEFYPPSNEFLDNVTIKDPEALRREAADDLEGYWARRAKELE